MKFFNRAEKRTHNHRKRDFDPYNLNWPMFWVSEEPEDFLSLENFLTGLWIFGGTGFGKTTGSGQTIARALLKWGNDEVRFGGIIGCAKVDEVPRWVEYCKKWGRSDDVILLGPKHDNTFNFLEFAVQQGWETEQILRLFTTLIAMMDTDRKGGGGDRFWQDSRDQLMTNLIDVIRYSRQPLSVKSMYDAVLDAPRSPEQVHSEDWQGNSFLFQCIREGEAVPKTESQQADFDLACQYILSEFPQMAERTRSSVIMTFTSFVNQLMRGSLRDLFCTTTTVTPADTFKGKIVILDMPIKDLGPLGRIGQTLFRYVWQIETEKRDVNRNPIPVFQFIDEAHLFCNSYDFFFNPQHAPRVARQSG